MIEEPLQKAATDLRDALAQKPVPIFEPETHNGHRLMLIAATFVLFAAGLGFFLTQPKSDDRQNQIAAEVTQTAPTASASFQGISGTNSLPVSDMLRPPTLGNIEPNFQTRIRALTAAGAGEAVLPLQVRPAWNSDGSYLLLYQTGGGTAGHALYETASSSTQPLSINPIDIEQVYWDPVQANLFYYIEVSSLIQYDVATAKKKVLHQFIGCESLSGVGSLRLSTDRTIGQLCVNKNDNQLLAYNINTGEETRSRTSGAEAPQPTPTSGRFISRDVTGNVSVLDNKLQPTGTNFRVGNDPYIVVETAKGDALATVIFSSDDLAGSLVTFDLDTGEPTVVVGKATGYPYPPAGTYLNTSVTNDALIAFTTATATADASPVALEGEITLVDLDTSNTVVRRLAHHRSTAAKTNPVWSAVHPAVHPEGNAIAFASDWDQDRVDTFLLTSHQP